MILPPYKLIRFFCSASKFDIFKWMRDLPTPYDRLVQRYLTPLWEISLFAKLRYTNGVLLDFIASLIIFTPSSLRKFLVKSKDPIP